MKNQLFGTSSNSLALLATLGTAALTFAMGGSTVYAGFDLGDAANYAVLYEGNGNNTLSINTGPINGNIGIGDPSGATTANLAFNNPGVINGNVVFAGAVNVSQNNGILNGSITGNNAQVQMDLNYLNALSSTLGGYAGAALSVNLNSGQSQTINASAGNIVNGNSVFNVGAFNFGNGATLTIHGDGIHNVVLNFAANAQFGGTILLTGGLTADQVLFNITGGAALMGGNTLQDNSNGALLAGTFLDPNGAMSLVHSELDGHYFGGDTSNMQIVSGDTINSPTPSVPDGGSTALLMSLGMGLIVVARKKLVG
jgi:hypothetical protein